MLLTSAGIRNDVLKSALADLVGKSFATTRVVFIPTASVAAAGDHGWFVEDLSRLHGLRWREFDILELNGLPGEMVLKRLRHADVIYVEGELVRENGQVMRGHLNHYPRYRIQQVELIRHKE